MITLETPQSFVTRQECDKVAFQNGFRRSHGETDGWRRYSSTTAQGSIWLAHDGAVANPRKTREKFSVKSRVDC